MTKLNKVWVLAQNLAELPQFRQGAAHLGETVEIVCAGSEAFASEAAASGARTHWIPLPETAMQEDAIPSITAILKQEKPDLLLVQPGRRGRLLAGRLAASLGTAAVVDASAISVNAQGQIEAAHLVYGGLAVRREKILAKPGIILANQSAFAEESVTPGKAGEIVKHESLPGSPGLRRIACERKESGRAGLHKAKKIVGVGRGLGKREDIALAEQFAELLDAQLACSRPLAEGESWFPKERYIGVSGAVLKPEVYFAIGISGQVQHMGGINQAKTIIAINRDKDAPIFKQTDYGLVGDLYQVLPALISLIRT